VFALGVRCGASAETSGLVTVAICGVFCWWLFTSDVARGELAIGVVMVGVVSWFFWCFAFNGWDAALPVAIYLVDDIQAGPGCWFLMKRPVCNFGECRLAFQFLPV